MASSCTQDCATLAAPDSMLCAVRVGDRYVFGDRVLTVTRLWYSPVYGHCVDLSDGSWSKVSCIDHTTRVKMDHIAAVLIATLHGSLPDRFAALLSDVESRAVLLDAAEQEWLHGTEWRLPVADRDWIRPGPHGEAGNPHVWFPARRIAVESGPLPDTYVDTESPVMIPEQRLVEVDDGRCTCGLWKSLHDSLGALGGKWVNGDYVWPGRPFTATHEIPMTTAALTADAMLRAFEAQGMRGRHG